MRVALIGTSHPFRGGLASYNERLAKEFGDMGHEFTLYTFTLQYPGFLFPGKTQYSEEPAPKGLKIIRCINSVNPFNWLSVGNRLRKENYDLIIVKFWLPFMGPCFGTILRRAKANAKTKVVCIVDNMIPHESRPGDRQFTKYFVKPVDAFVAMSKNVLSDIDQFEPSKPKTLSPHPLFDNFGEALTREEAISKLGLDNSKRYVLFFGLIRKYKGLDILLEAFADERIRNKDLKLIVAGEYYSDKEEYKAIIENRGLADHVIETNGFINDSDVKLYFCAADLVVQPYRSATQSGVTQIAYHFNKPMVVSDVGGLGELCPHEKVGYVVAPEPDAIANAVHRFFEEGKQEAFTSNVIQEKKKYTWDILVSNILKLAEQV